LQGLPVLLGITASHTQIDCSFILFLTSLSSILFQAPQLSLPSTQEPDLQACLIAGLLGFAIKLCQQHHELHFWIEFLILI
jgi:hypothetical protein